MRKFYWILLLAFTGLIFFHSSLPAADSNLESYFFAKIFQSLLMLIGRPEDLPAVNHFVRKAAHYTEFFIQALLLCKAFSSLGLSRMSSAGCILFLGLATAVTDEYIQLFSPGRAGMIVDVILDFSGTLTAFFCYQLWSMRRKDD